MNPSQALRRAIAISLLPTAIWAAPNHDGFMPPDPSLHGQFIPRERAPAVHGDNLVLRSLLGTGGAPFPGTTFNVLREEPDAFGKTRYTVMATSGPQAIASFRLAPGEYRISASNGAVTTSELIEVPAQGVYHHDIVLDAGELRLSSRLSNAGGPAGETWFRVFREDTDSYGRPVRAQVAGNGYADAASFILPTGDYLAEATYGDARVLLPVSVRGGQTTEQSMLLNAGRIELSTLLGAGRMPLDEVTYRVSRKTVAADGGYAWTQVLSTGAVGTVMLVLPAGEYRIQAQLGQAVEETNVHLDAGETLPLELDMHAAIVHLFAQLSGHTQPLLNTVFGMTRVDAQLDHDATRQGPAHKARFILPAGRYLASASNGESRAELELEIVAGDEARFEIPLDAGRVTLNVAPPANTAASPFNWFSVYKVERDARGSVQRRRVFNDGFYSATDLILPAGSYVAQARSDYWRGESSFSVAPGDIRTVSIPAAP